MGSSDASRTDANLPDERPSSPAKARTRGRADQRFGGSKQALSELAQHLQTSVESERAAIAREIHDDVGGTLSAVKYELSWIARHSESPEVLVRVESALDALNHAIEASQRIMHNLRPAILEQGLVAALQWLALQLERRSGVVCQFRTSHEVMDLPPSVPLVAYRFAQESLTNISKHAQATKSLIDVSLARSVLSLEVSDNGRGLQLGDLAKARSFGIRGLRERASTVGGWVDVTSGPDGTTVMLSIPVQGLQAREFKELQTLDTAHDPSTWSTTT